jgi:protein-S-isoprenylcysteine O-methyltransferase Ste14
VAEAPDEAVLPDWRTTVFAQRGALLAISAATLVLFGRPSGKSVASGIPIALAGEALRCWAVGYSGVTTRSDRLTAPALVTAGPYAYVRNPLYVGNFITALGFTIAFTGALSPAKRAFLSILGLGSMLAVYATIVPLEESYLRKTFGASFEEYVARVPRLIPRSAPSEPQSGTYDAGVIARAETRTFLTFGAMLLALGLKMPRR